MKTQMLSRQGEATMALARRLLGFRLGDRLPTFHSMAQEFGVSNGTLQSAMGVLSESGAVSVESRGRLGSFITGIDHSQLWDFSGNAFVSIAMPMPYSLRYEGLATGLQAAFLEHRIPFTLQFVRGGRHRLRLLSEGRVDYTVVSGYTASVAEGVEIARDFGPKTYVGGHGIVIRQGLSHEASGLRLGVDNSSIDQIQMTKFAFGDLDRHELVKVSYQQLGRAFSSGRIDATVWNLDEVTEHLPVPVDLIELDASWQFSTHAVIVKPAGVAEIATVQNVLNSHLVPQVASQVCDGSRMPSY